MEERIALFPGSFDPFTRGHQAIVEQALRLFDKVVIAIGDNCAKRGMLSVESRQRLIEKLYADEPRVEVVVYGCLTGDYCRQEGIRWMIRGVRNVADFEYERNICDANRMLFPDVETLLLITPPELAAVSSSTVREVVAFGGDCSALMPEGIDLAEWL